MAKPLFKYIGGKTWLKEKLREQVSNVLSKKTINTYVEPFAGGLGAFLGIYDLLIENNVKKVILSDINIGLINLYNDIKFHSEQLCADIINLEQEFSKTVNEPASNKHTKEELEEANQYFKTVRSNFNLHKGDNSTEQSARLVFLQKHSFNGVYRENGKGDYNTPFNWSAATIDLTIKDRIVELKQVFDAFDIVFEVKSYEHHDYNDNALFYLDPPYLNTKDVMENKYNKDGFNIDNQLDLINKIQQTNFIYSNHDSEILENELNKNSRVEIARINRKNIMSASSASRADDKSELLATFINI